MRFSTDSSKLIVAFLLCWALPINGSFVRSPAVRPSWTMESCAFRTSTLAKVNMRSSSTRNTFTTLSSSSSVSTTVPETSPLHPGTFAGQVEQGMLDRFGADDVSRVIESWRLVDASYEHREFVGGQQDPPIPEEAAETSNCHQHCISYVRGLPARTFWNTEDFDWTKKLAAHYDEIKAEFTRVTADMDSLTQKGNNIWAAALTEDASSYGEGWRTLVLMDRGVWDPVNVNLFPKTAMAVKECGVPAVEVFFASMKPHTDIKLHSDFTNFVLTSHLALDIPESGKNKCRLTIGDDTRQWINGELMLFDTSIMHDAVNESDKTRYILMVRLFHPALTDVERKALQFTYDCLMVPDLVSSNPNVRFIANAQVASMHAFPEIEKKEVEGFGSKKKSSNKKKKKQRGSGGGGFGA